MPRIYFDHNSTTPVAPPVAAAILTALQDQFGNPSSVHTFGQRAKTALDEARSAVANLVGGNPSEVVFTSSGTESDNLAIRGVADVLESTTRRHLIAGATEHEAVLNTLKVLGRRGWDVTFIQIGTNGILEPNQLAESIDNRTALVSVMHANNEIGTIQPVAELAELAHHRGALFHTDAVQSAGKILVDVKSLGVDLLSLSAHKLNGPKGIGALWIRKGTRLMPVMFGGRQERNRRAGTENMPGIVGFGVAAELAKTKLGEDAVRLGSLRNRLESGILDRVPHTNVNGDRVQRVPNTTNISFDAVEAESLLIALDLEGVAVSTGSACSSGTLEPSHVLRAMGLPTHRTQTSIRFSLGSGNTQEEIDHVIGVLPQVVKKLRHLTR